MTPDYSGSLPAAHVQRYQEFGDWTRACYNQSNMLARLGRQQPVRAGDSLVLPLPSGASFDRLWLM